MDSDHAAVNPRIPVKRPNDRFSKLVSSFAFEASTSHARVAASASVASKRRREENQVDESRGQKSSKARKITRDISHLPPLQDRLVEYLDVVFCGCNPGYTSARVGYHYGNTQNAFWRCLNQSGFTETVLTPDQGPSLPQRYSIGLTDLVTTPSHAFSDISSQERKASVLSLLRRIAFYKPRILALNSFAIWSDIAAELGKRNAVPGVSLKAPVGQATSPLKLPRLEENRKPEFLPWKIVHTHDIDTDLLVKETLIIPLPGTSGANASYSLSEKVSFFRAIHDTLPLIKDGTFSTKHMREIMVDLTEFEI